MNYKELLYNKNKVLSFFPELAIIFNKYDELSAKEREKSGEKKKKTYGNGLNKAIFINQLNYWIEINEKANKNFKDGHYWVYNSYENWSKNDFQYWSTDTIKRIVGSLEGIGVIVSTNYNKLKIDKTKWYRIDYDRLQEIIDIVKNSEKEKQSATKEIADCDNDGADCTDHSGNMNKAIPEITPKTTFRDYNNVSCNSQDIYIPDSDENIDMYAGFPKQENPETEKKSRFIPVDYTEEQLAEHVKPVYRKVIDGYYGHIGDGAEEDTETLTKITIYFHRKFREKYHSRCRILSDKAYIRIAENFCEPPICMEGVYDFERYARMIDRYIETELNKSGNYEGEVIPSLAHFMSDEFRKNNYWKTNY